MPYVTRGKVQVELKAGNGEIEVRIDPIQDYTVKHEKDNLTVFISINDDLNVQPLRAIAFKKTQRFRTTKESLVQPLTYAALKQIAIEIKIPDAAAVRACSPPCSPLESTTSDPIEIESIKIPGTLGSDKA
jgi:hypothetical protein